MMTFLNFLLKIQTLHWIKWSKIGLKDLNNFSKRSNSIFLGKITSYFEVIFLNITETEFVWY